MRERPARTRKPKRLSDYYYPVINRRQRNVSGNVENENNSTNRVNTRAQTINQSDLIRETLQNRSQTPRAQTHSASPTNRAMSPPTNLSANQTTPLTNQATNQATNQVTTQTTQTENSQSPNLTTKQIMEKIYADPNFPSYYSGDVKKFILEKASLSRHKRKFHKFKRRQIFVNGPFTQIQADTAFMLDFARWNHGYKYILAVVDCFSRKNYVRPMKTTTAEESARNLDSILDSMDFKPTQFSSDMGNEFNVRNKNIYNILVDKYGMLIFILKPPKKAAIVERFILTLKQRLYRYMTDTGSKNWVDVLQDISEAINNTTNRSIKMPPNEVNFDNR